MIPRVLFAIGLFAGTIILAGCAPTSPNTTVKAVVKKIVAKTHQGLAALNFYPNHDIYAFDLLTDNGELYYAWLRKGQAEEPNLQEVIGERVTFTCYRKDVTTPTCSEPIVSLVWNGRELVKK
jgi:hypothetical protein